MAYAAGVPPTAVRSELAADVVWDPHERFSRGLNGGRTQQHPLSAINAKN